jgi:hypothetical protein
MRNGLRIRISKILIVFITCDECIPDSVGGRIDFLILCRYFKNKNVDVVFYVFVYVVVFILSYISSLLT